MSARKFRNSWWVDLRDPQGKRYRLRSPVNTKADALLYEGILRQKLAHGEPLEVKPPDKPQVKTFNVFALEWMEVYAKTNNKPSTVRSKYNALRAHLLPYFGHMLLNEITELSVQQFKSIQNQNKLSAKSINNQLSVLRRCVKSAYSWGLVPHPVKIEELRVAPQKYDFLTQEEAIVLVANAPESMWKEMIICGLDTGMRLGELCALDWEDINFTTRALTVCRSLVEGRLDSPKNNKIRTIPLTSRLFQMLSIRKQNRGFVFAHPDGGHLRKSSWPWKALRRACKAAGLRYFGWHVLRHTFASELVRRGAAIRAVQLLLGHSTVQMTERYSHLAPSALQETVALLERTEIKSDSSFFGQPAGNMLQKLFAEAA